MCVLLCASNSWIVLLFWRQICQQKMSFVGHGSFFHSNSNVTTFTWHCYMQNSPELFWPSKSEWRARHVDPLLSDLFRVFLCFLSPRNDHSSPLIWLYHTLREIQNLGYSNCVKLQVLHFRSLQIAVFLFWIKVPSKWISKIKANHSLLNINKVTKLKSFRMLRGNLHPEFFDIRPVNCSALI